MFDLFLIQIFKVLIKVILFHTIFFSFGKYVHADFLKNSKAFYKELRSDPNEQLFIQIAPSHREYITDPGYLTPNETRLQEAIPILSKSNGGVYITTGSDRGFMSAALAGSSHLLILDHSHDVTVYNRLNIALLKLSRNREDYIFLRKKATYKDWNLRLKEIRLDERYEKLIKNKNFWKWWKSNVRNSSYRVFNSRKTSKKDYPFKGVNYLYVDQIFHKIHTLAKKDNIEAHIIKLGDKKNLIKKVIESVKTSNLKIGVLDLSNLWKGAYLGEEKALNLIKAFNKISEPNSILLIVDHAKPPYDKIIDPRFPSSYPDINWKYLGYTFRYVKYKSRNFEPGHFDFEKELMGALTDVSKKDACINSFERAMH